MDTSDVVPNLPWKNLQECEEVIKYLFDKKVLPIKRRQLLIQIQRLTNISGEYSSQFYQTIVKCSTSNYKEEFLKNLNQDFNTSLVLLNILMRNKTLDNDLINIFELNGIQEKNLFQMKAKQLKRMINQFEELKVSTNNKHLLSDDNITTNATMEHMLSIFTSSDSLNDSRIEKQFYKFFKLNNQYDNECEHLLMNVLIEAEYKLSEPTIGMILDQLEKMDYRSSR